MDAADRRALDRHERARKREIGIMQIALLDVQREQEALQAEVDAGHLTQARAQEIDAALEKAQYALRRAKGELHESTARWIWLRALRAARAGDDAVLVPVEPLVWSDMLRCAGAYL